MTDEQQQQGPEGAAADEELREQLEEEIRKVKVQDLILQSVVSILNLAARRIAKDDERDLEQGRQGIDAASALVELVPSEAQAQLRQAISELQLLYAKHAGEGPAEGPGEPTEPEKPPEAAPEQKPESGLWTPPGA